MKKVFRNINIESGYRGERYYEKVQVNPSYAPEAGMKVILDTDVAWLNDDNIAMALCIGSPDIELIGVTVVEGNYDQNQEIIEGLSILERMGYEDVPMWKGAERPLAHYRGRYEEDIWGEYAVFPEFDYPLGRPPRKQAEPGSAALGIIKLVHQYPHQVTIFAIGPLTNVALALEADPEVAELLKGILIVGGVAAGLVNGAGNSAPCTEFNFYCDPEAAAIVLRSGVPMLVTSLNAIRDVTYTKEFHEQVCSLNNVVSAMLKERMEGVFDEDGATDLKSANFSNYGLCDSSCCMIGMKPGLGHIERLVMQIDLSHGPSYGASYCYHMKSPAQAKIDNDPWVYNAMIQPSRLYGPVSDPVEVDVVTRVPDPEAVRRECLKRFANLHATPDDFYSMMPQK